MPTLNPAPNTVGIFAPYLGPWFVNNATIIGVPAADLSVAFNPLNDNVCPPAGGTLSLFVAANPLPLALTGLRRADGTAAFTANGNMVALFRLLPEVESRLHALTAANIPSVTNGAGVLPTRPRVRYFAYEFAPAALTTAGTPPENHLQTLLGFNAYPAWCTAQVDKLAHLGLTLNNNVWGNAATPMSDLCRPGGINGNLFPILGFAALFAQTNVNVNVNLWTFDSRGRPIDPGAVADWWRLLAQGSGGNPANMWAPGLNAGTQRTAAVNAQRTVQLVNAHEGPLDATTRARVNLGGLTAVGGSNQLFVVNVGVNPTVGFTAAPAPDDLPTPLAAVLPDGSYGAAANPWNTGATLGLQRDFCRVAVVSVEHQLVGQTRHVVPASPTAADTSRAGAQNDAAKQVLPGRVATPVLLDTHEQVLTAMGAVIPAIVPPLPPNFRAREVVAAQLDGGFGPLINTPPPPPQPPPLPQAIPGVLGLPAAALPTVAPAVQAFNLVATVDIANNNITGQKALLRFSAVPVNPPQPLPPGAWVRAWTQGFDPAKGEHYNLDGGAGVVDLNGNAHVVVPLQDGVMTPDALMGVDIIVVTALGAVQFADIRFPRPAANATIAAVNFATLVAGDTLLVCETGVQSPPALAQVPSGCSLVVVTNANTPALVDPTTLPPNVHPPTAIIRRLVNGDRVELTDNAFRRAPTGDPDNVFVAVVGAGNLHHQTRASLNAWQAGYPLHGMERHEVVLGNSQTGQALVAASALARYHENLPHAQGHPLCPATADIHATGALLVGPGARSVLEFTRDRTAGTTPELALAAAAAIPAPAAPAAPSAWAVGLRTIGNGVEVEYGLDALMGLLTSDTFTANWNAAVAWWNTNMVPPAPNLPANALGDAPRALDRRLHAGRGLREGATSLLAALARAEDFIYIETPALDNLAFGDTGDRLQPWQALINRMDACPSLRVILCVPVYLPPGTPRALQRVRNSLLLKACGDLVASPSRAGRFVRFSPAAGPGRSLRIASTTVIVDDAYAMTGTTHLWRRGLSFDSSFAAAVFDENLDHGRPADIANFRRRLLAGRLGVSPADVSEDPAEMIAAIELLQKAGGFGSLAVAALSPPDPNQTPAQNNVVTDEDAWNPDGSFQDGFDVAGLIANILTNDLEDEFVPAP